MVCGAEAAVLCVSSGGGGAARGRPAHRGGAALVCVATTRKESEPRLGRESGRFVLGFGSSGRFVTVFSRCKPYQPLPCKWQNALPVFSPCVPFLGAHNVPARCRCAHDACMCLDGVASHTEL